MSVHELRASIAAGVISNMSEARQSGERAQPKIETAIRFVVLVVPGFLIFLFCCLELLVELSYGEPSLMNPLLAVPLALLGGLMVLAGTGQWGRWAYLLIFVSTPTVATIWALIVPFLLDIHPELLHTHPKLLGTAIFALPMVVSYALVRRYYRRRDAPPRGQ